MFRKIISRNISSRKPAWSCFVPSHVSHSRYNLPTPLHARSFSSVPEEDPMEAMRREFEGLDVAHSEKASEDANAPAESYMQSIFGIKTADGGLPKLPTSGNTGVHWASASDPNNPFTFPILNLQPVLEKSELSLHIAEHLSDRPAQEVLSSFSEIAAQMSKPGGVLDPNFKGEGDSAASDNAGQSSTQDAYSQLNKDDTDPEDGGQVRMAQSLCAFAEPLVIRYPVTKSMIADLQNMFLQTKDAHKEQDGSLEERLYRSTQAYATNDAALPPPMRVLQKANLSGGRFDAYLAGRDGDVIFITSNVTPRALRAARAAQREKYARLCEEAKAHNRAPPPLLEEHVSVERHHVITLAHRPTIEPLPYVLAQMDARCAAEQGRDYDPVIAMLEITAIGTLTTYDVNDIVGAPSTDKAFRAAEVSFLVRNVIFGATLPAPIPPSMWEAAREDLRGELDPVQGDRRREVIARTIAALYGGSSGLAAVPLEPGHSMVEPHSIGNDPSLAVLYGDPDLYIRD